MKKILFSVLLLCGSSLITNAQNPDFRAFAWGTSFSQVQYGENAALLKNIGDDEILYKDVLGGFHCNVAYIFNENNKLESGMYIFTKKYSNPQLYVEDYNIFKKLLNTRYGKPIAENEVWSYNVKPYDTYNYGQAVVDNKLFLNTVWKTARSEIKISLINTNGKPMLEIQYTALSMGELLNMDIINGALKKL